MVMFVYKNRIRQKTNEDIICWGFYFLWYRHSELIENHPEKMEFQKVTPSVSLNSPLLNEIKNAETQV